jgi:hypothetical protein
VKAIFVKTNQGLAPASDEALKVLGRYQFGEEVIVEHKRGRSAKQHRYAFKFFAMTFDLQDEYDSPDVWRKVLEISAGHFDPVVDKNGRTHLWPRSIAWDALDQDQFNELFNHIQDAFLAKYSNGISCEQLEAVMGARP